MIDDRMPVIYKTCIRKDIISPQFGNMLHAKEIYVSLWHFWTLTSNKKYEIITRIKFLELMTFDFGQYSSGHTFLIHIKISGKTKQNIFLYKPFRFLWVAKNYSSHG